jgi:hypothetical protein
MDLPFLKEGFDHSMMLSFMKVFMKDEPHMDEFLKKYAEIFDNLSDYVLVGSQESSVILKVSTMSFYIIEEDYIDIKKIMVKMGVRLIQDAEQVRLKEFEMSRVIWNEDQGTMRTVTQQEFEQILKNKNQKKK